MQLSFTMRPPKHAHGNTGMITIYQDDALCASRFSEAPGWLVSLRGFSIGKKLNRAEEGVE